MSLNFSWIGNCGTYVKVFVRLWVSNKDSLENNMDIQIEWL